MVRALNQFNDSFIRISKIDSIYLHWVNSLKLSHTEVEDLLRSEIVYAVSALDRLIHELVKIGMIEIFLGTRPATTSYMNFPLSLSQHKDINTPGGLPPEAVFQNIIIAKHSYLTFQDPIKIKDALNYIWIEDHKWQVIGAAMGMTDVAVKEKLNNIVIRRNQIAHEMDLDISTGLIQPISHADTTDIVGFIKNLGHCIHKFL